LQTSLRGTHKGRVCRLMNEANRIFIDAGMPTAESLRHEARRRRKQKRNVTKAVIITLALEVMSDDHGEEQLPCLCTSGCDVRKLIVRFRRSQISLSRQFTRQLRSTDRSAPLRNNNLGEVAIKE
jgi:hypothetical protein